MCDADRVGDRFLKTYNYTGTEPFNLQNQVQLQLKGQNVLISKAVLRTIYKELRNRIITPPTAQLKYNVLFENDDELDWKKIYCLPHRVALDTKSREFQYKLLNRCLATNVLLSKSWNYFIPSLFFLRGSRRISRTYLYNLPLHQEVLGRSYKMDGPPEYPN